MNLITLNLQNNCIKIKNKKTYKKKPNKLNSNCHKVKKFSNNLLKKLVANVKARIA